MTPALSLLLERIPKKSIGTSDLIASTLAEYFAPLPTEHVMLEHVALILYPNTRSDTERRYERAFWRMRVPDIQLQLKMKSGQEMT